MDIGFLLLFLLRSAWVAATIPILIASIPSMKVNWFHHLLLSFAKRGKIMQSTSKKNFTVPQKFFCHFYILAVSWTTLLLFTTCLYANTMEHSGTFLHGYKIWRSVFLLILVEAQVLRRLFECLYVHKFSPSARMHVLGYLTGIFFYTAAPISVCCTYVPEVFTFIVNLVQEFIYKEKDQMQITEFDWWGFMSPFTQFRLYTWIGGAIFLWGWFHQGCCHKILASLRNNHDQVDEYAIPHGDWFEYVSSPHYLAEIVIYAGLVVASGFSDLTVWLLFIFVVANLVFAAAETHRWYRRKFDNYPKDRFAILPFVY